MTVLIHEKFVDDMDRAGIVIEPDYHGRYFYSGPAVYTNEREWPTLQDVIRASSVKVQWDNLGRDWVVYPV